jgi:O-antigen ligase
MNWAQVISSRPLFARLLSRPRLERNADWVAAAVAVSLPWSTSATSVLLVLWLIAVGPTLGLAAVRREVMSPAGGLPVLLWALAALGMLWADVSWSDRIEGLAAFSKLLAIPLLLAQFRRSDRARWVAFGFLGSALVLLVVSWWLALAPGLTWRGPVSPGVPTKDYILQSGIFALCALGLLAQAVESWRAGLTLVLALVAAAFLANIVYVATGRTTIAVVVVLILLLGFRLFGWRGVLAAGLVVGVLAGLAWMSSPYLRERVTHVVANIQDYRSNVNTPVGLRFEFWRKSMDFVAEAPVIGHGTGTISTLFRARATPETLPQAITTNPHSQILAVAIQLGLIGVVVLSAMWIAHLALFRGGGLITWFGLMVVVENIVSSLFNSHLADFAQGWLYVLGVGALGGMVLRRPSVPQNGGRAMSAPHDILVPISVGELLDKITILEIKSERIKNPGQIENIARELGALRAVRLCDDIDRAVLERLGAELKRVNATLWDVEDAIRECDARGDFGEKFIELARAVYRLNDERARLKKAINLASGSRLVEEKSYKSFDREGSEQSR